MLSLISFLLVSIGCINWFSIGILQFDFVAGIFGSQSNIFSRLIYTLVGIASIIMIINFITNKGKFIVSFKKANEDFEEMKEQRVEEKRKRALATESSEEFSLAKKLTEENDKNLDTESSNDFGEDIIHYNNTHTKADNCECSKDNHKDCNCKNNHYQNNKTNKNN